MNRIRLPALFLAALVALASWPSAGAEPAAPLMLRAAVTVDADVIRLGDLFEGTVESGYIPVAKAPAPGESLTLDARWLAAASRAFKLSWKPGSRFEQSVVTRASTRISPEAVKNAVVAAIADAGSIDDFSAVDFQFDAAPLGLEIGTGTDGTLAVHDLVIDERSGRFSARVVAPAHGPEADSVQVAGKRIELTEVPVLSTRRLPGEVILASDVEWARMRSDRVGSSALLDPAEIIGKTPRRPVRAGELLRANDLDRALTIRKGSLVTITLQSPQMTLTVLGKALEDGAKGQPIQVMNTKSNRIVQGVVQDPGTVVVIALQ